IVSDHEATTSQVREVLRREGLDCSAGQLLPLDLAAERLAGAHPEMVVVALAPDPEKALAGVGRLHLVPTLPRLAAGRARDSRLVLRALRSGATDYVDDDDLEGELRTALGRMRSGLPAQAKPARTIAVLAPSGGSGSSTLAVNVAASLARQHHSALLV